MQRPLEQVLAGIQRLEPLPAVAVRVLEIARREDLVPSELVAIIETDAALTARVLKLANSSLFGFAREIATLSEAGNALGTSQLTGLVLTSCTGRWFQRFGGQDPEQRKRSWELAIASALAAQLFARLSGAVDPQRAYTAGLLQDIGELCIARFLPEAAAAIQAATLRGQDPLLAERAALGVDHAEFGARLAQQWGFPLALVDAIRTHHEPERSKHDPLLATYVELGHEVALCLLSKDEPSAHAAGERLAAAGFVHSEVETELIARLAEAREFVDCD